MDNAIPSVCNCEYQDELFGALERALKRFHKKHNYVQTHELVYTMAQLGTFYLLLSDCDKEAIRDLYNRSIDSLQLRDEVQS